MALTPTPKRILIMTPIDPVTASKWVVAAEKLLKLFPFRKPTKPLTPHELLEWSVALEKHFADLEGKATWSIEICGRQLTQKDLPSYVLREITTRSPQKYEDVTRYMKCRKEIEQSSDRPHPRLVPIHPNQVASQSGRGFMVLFAAVLLFGALALGILGILGLFPLIEGIRLHKAYIHTSAAWAPIIARFGFAIVVAFGGWALVSTHDVLFHADELLRSLYPEDPYGTTNQSRKSWLME
jgi:hypothetical protein